MSALYFSISRDQACSLPARHSLTRRVSFHVAAGFFGALSITGRHSPLHCAVKLPDARRSAQPRRKGSVIPRSNFASGQAQPRLAPRPRSGQQANPRARDSGLNFARGSPSPPSSPDYLREVRLLLQCTRKVEIAQGGGAATKNVCARQTLLWRVVRGSQCFLRFFTIFSVLNSEKRNTEDTKEAQRTTEKSGFLFPSCTHLLLHGFLSVLCGFSPC